MSLEVQRRLQRNIKLVYLLNMSWMFMTILPIMIPFFQSKGLSMENIYQLQSIFAVVVLVLELPSGYISDLLGRKKTLILSGVLHAIGCTIFPFADSFLGLAIAEVLLGVALSLFSGTDMSLLYDSLKELESKGNDKTKDYGKTLGQKMFYQQLGEAVAGLLGGWLVYISLNAPAIVEAIVSWFPLIIVLFVYEPSRSLMDKKKHKENFIYIYKSLFRHSRLLTMIIGINVVFSSSTLLAVWAFQKYWQDINVPLTSFGYLWASLNIVTAVVARKAQRLEDWMGSGKAIVLLALLPIVGYFGLAYSESLHWGVWGILFCFFFQISRGINSVVLKNGLNRRVSGDMRATANSVLSLGTRLIFVFIGPLIGFLIDHHGNQIAFSYMGWTYLVMFAVLVLPFLRLRRDFIR